MYPSGTGSSLSMRILVCNLIFFWSIDIRSSSRSRVFDLFWVQGDLGNRFILGSWGNLWKGLGRSMPPWGKKGFMPGGNIPGEGKGGLLPSPKGLAKFRWLEVELGVEDILGEEEERERGEGLVTWLGEGWAGERIWGEGESCLGELGSIDPPASRWLTSKCLFVVCFVFSASCLSNRACRSANPWTQN